MLTLLTRAGEKEKRARGGAATLSLLCRGEGGGRRCVEQQEARSLHGVAVALHFCMGMVRIRQKPWVSSSAAHPHSTASSARHIIRVLFYYQMCCCVEAHKIAFLRGDGHCGGVELIAHHFVQNCTMGACMRAQAIQKCL